LVRRAQHRLDAGGKPEKREDDQENGKGAEQHIQPVTNPHADHHAGHEFDDHPPGHLALRKACAYRCVSLYGLALHPVQPRFQGAQPVGIGFVSHLCVPLAVGRKLRGVQG